MSQPTLFEPPRARLTDPVSSHAAADRHERTGRLALHQAEARRLVAVWPGRTCRSIAAAEEPDDLLAQELLYRRLGRRLKEVAEPDDRKSPEGVRWFPRRAAAEVIRSGRLT